MIDKPPKIEKPEDEWRRTLTPEQYHIAREKGTERAFTGKYWNEHADGTYRCAACGAELFSSDTKFDSGSGWPSFFEPMNHDAVVTREDNSFFMRRTEVLCANCGAHLGHLFDDGPNPTGLRYCINSAILDLAKKAETSETDPAHAGVLAPGTDADREKEPTPGAA